MKLIHINILNDLKSNAIQAPRQYIPLQWKLSLLILTAIPKVSCFPKITFVFIVTCCLLPSYYFPLMLEWPMLSFICHYLPTLFNVNHFKATCIFMNSLSTWINHTFISEGVFYACSSLKKNYNDSLEKNNGNILSPRLLFYLFLP